MRNRPTQEIYRAFEDAYAFFNFELFGNRLPHCMLTLKKKRGSSGGRFVGDCWGDPSDHLLADEISLDPDFIRDDLLVEVLSTLVHKMVHLQQFHYGTPGARGYHNIEWAKLMNRVGLVPSSTGTSGGKEIGYRMSQYSSPAGPFDIAVTELVQSGFTFAWLSRQQSKPLKKGQAERDRRQSSRSLFICRCCGEIVQGKHGANIICGDCIAPMYPQNASH